MKRIVLKIGVIVLLVSVLSVFRLWWSGMLYFRLSDAKVTLNGTKSTASTVYRSGNGDYLIFLDPELAQQNVYTVVDNGKHIGIPASRVPSSYTKSFMTSGFVLCLQCGVVLAGTDKLDLKAEVSETSEELTFKVYSDAVTITF